MSGAQVGDRENGEIGGAGGDKSAGHREALLFGRLKII